MEHKTPFQLAKDLEASLHVIFMQIDADLLPLEQRQLTALIKRHATDARLDIRDYGMVDTRAQQLRIAQEIKNSLELLQKNIVNASQYNLLSAIDVAQISAGIQQIISELE